ncbi:MAG: type II secretion system protein GspE, partial [Rhodocyclaceae bacterium]|nr:type II secretion system protein GspE [Rhodocyclaceae bacterium]
MRHDTPDTLCDSPRPLLGELLVRRQKLAARDLEQALAAQAQMGGLLGRVLVRLGLVSETDLAEALSEQLQLSLARADDFPDEPLDAPGLQTAFLLTHQILPLCLTEDGALEVAMAVPQDDFLQQALALASGRRIVPRLAMESELAAALDRLYVAPEREEEAEAHADAAADGGEFVEHLKDLATEAPVIRLVNQIIARVIDLAASDI